jgi:hypothetical protein
MTSLLISLYFVILFYATYYGTDRDALCAQHKEVTLCYGEIDSFKNRACTWNEVNGCISNQPPDTVLFQTVSAVIISIISIPVKVFFASNLIALARQPESEMLSSLLGDRPYAKMQTDELIEYVSLSHDIQSTDEDGDEINGIEYYDTLYRYYDFCQVDEEFSFVLNAVYQFFEYARLQQSFAWSEASSSNIQVKLNEINQSK